MHSLYYSTLSFQDWSFYLAASPEGLCFVGSSPASREEFDQWTAVNFPKSTIIKDEVLLAPYVKAFKDYLSKESTNVSVPTHLVGTTFQKKVWAGLLTIPYGETVSYSELAVRIGKEPSAARAVGTAIGKNPLLIFYPCHRVVPKSSKARGFRGGLEMKERLLSLEQSAN